MCIVLQGFFNFTLRRPRYLLEILELGYSVLYNDVDMVWLEDPFPYFKGNHDVYFTDDMTLVSSTFLASIFILNVLHTLQLTEKPSDKVRGVYSFVLKRTTARPANQSDLVAPSCWGLTSISEIV